MLNFRKAKLLFAILFSSVICQTVQAKVENSSVMQAYDELLNAFVLSSKDYQAVDEDAFNQAVEFSDKPVSAITRALQQVEAHESMLPAARYVVRGWFKYVAEQPQLLLQISRYNHGERITAEIQANYGDNARKALASDKLPHVDYRMGVMQVPMTRQFDALKPHRRIILDAATESCLRSDCLQPAWNASGEAIPPLANSKAKPFQAKNTYQVDAKNSLPHWSWMAEALMKEAGLHQSLDSFEAREGNSLKPDFEIRLDYNLYGQDQSHHGVLCQYDVMDDQVKDICWQVLAVTAAKPYWYVYKTKRVPLN